MSINFGSTAYQMSVRRKDAMASCQYVNSVVKRCARAVFLKMGAFALIVKTFFASVVKSLFMRLMFIIVLMIASITRVWIDTASNFYAGISHGKCWSKDFNMATCKHKRLIEICVAGYNTIEHCGECGRVFVGGIPLDLWGVDHEFVSPSDYQADVMDTANGIGNSLPLLTNWALGLTGEAGEVADIVKKHVFHGKELDKKHLAEEVGDVLWYAAMVCNWLEVDMGEVMRANIEKLKARHPNGFDGDYDSQVSDI